MQVEGLLVNLDAATLATMKTDWLTCVNSIASGHQSYSVAGRTITRANLSDAVKMLAEITYAQSIKNGTLHRFVRNDMSCP